MPSTDTASSAAKNVPLKMLVAAAKAAVERAEAAAVTAKAAMKTAKKDFKRAKKVAKKARKALEALLEGDGRKREKGAGRKTKTSTKRSGAPKTGGKRTGRMNTAAVAGGLDAGA